MQSVSGRLRGAFGSFFHSEALPGALPPRQNSPQHPAYGLFPELISGTAFTAPRSHNNYSWVYRQRPSAYAANPGAVRPLAHERFAISHTIAPAQPRPMRFQAPSPARSDFVDGLTTLAVCGAEAAQDGASANVFSFERSMKETNKVFRNHDADMLFMPYQGVLQVRTEFGTLEVHPQQMCLIPRGLVMQVNELSGGACAGYVLENFGAPFEIPGLGPIGISGGLAHPRHFEAPQAAFDEDCDVRHQMVCKMEGRLFEGELPASPFDVVAYYGNLLPLHYDFRDFMAINTVTYDHPDPSIGVVMSSYTPTPGTANIDFVIFPSRWMAGENTFRPPWFHRNVMSEFMGLIHGTYDAKPGAFTQGCASIHNKFVPHGPNEAAVRKATENLDTSHPQRYNQTLAFMWESNKVWHPSPVALEVLEEKDYYKCWGGFERSRFDRDAKVERNPPFPFDGSRTEPQAPAATRPPVQE